MFRNDADPTFDVFDNLIQLREGGVAEPAAHSYTAEGAGLWTVATYRVLNDEDLHSDHWERHPEGHEVLIALSGAMDLYLRDHRDGKEPVATLRPGRSFIVPPGRWHRLTLREPGDLMALTPRPGTSLEPVGDTTPATED